MSSVADFATLLAEYSSGFVLLLEPFDERYPDVPDPTLQLACVDASIAIKPVLERFQTVSLLGHRLTHAILSSTLQAGGSYIRHNFS